MSDTRYQIPDVGCHRFAVALTVLCLLLSTGFAADEGSALLDEAKVEQMLKELGAEEDWEVTAIGSLLAEASGKHQVAKKFLVLPLREANAWATAQGYVLVTEALLELLNTQDQIAFVLAHELAHLLKEHPQQALTKKQSAEMARRGTQALFGETLVGEAVRFVVEEVLNFYSREMEREADVEAVRLMSEAGFDGKEAAQVLSALSRTRQGYGCFSTHPSLARRAKLIQNVSLISSPRQRPLIEPPPDLLPEVHIELVGQVEKAKLPDNLFLKALRSHFEPVLRDLEPQNFKLPRKWQLRRAQRYQVRLTRLHFELTPLPKLDGWKRFEARYNLKLLAPDAGEPLVEEQVQVSSVLAKGERLEDLLRSQAKVLAKRIGRRVIEAISEQLKTAEHAEGAERGREF